MLQIIIGKKIANMKTLNLCSLIILIIFLNGCSNSIKDKLEEAKIYSTAKKYKEAIQIYNQILKIDSTNFHALGQRGLMYYNLTDANRALLDYNKALTSNPQAFDIYYNRGLVFYALKDYNNALKDFDIVISNNSNDYMALYYRGYIKMIKNEHIEAIQDFNKAIIIHPKDYFYENRGVCKFFLKDITGALSDLSEAITINSKNTSALFSRGNIYYSLNKYQEAIADLEKVVSLNPKDTNAIIWLKKSQEKLNGK